MSLSPTSLNPAANHTGSTVTEVDGCSPNANDASGQQRRINHSRSTQSKLSPNTNRRLFVHENYTRSPTSSVDARLHDWLGKHSIDNISRNIILGELFTYEDFVYELEKNDLHRIGLKLVQSENSNFDIYGCTQFIFPLFRCGVEVRLWRAIQSHRKQFKTITEEIADCHLNHNEDINRNNVKSAYQCPIITYEPSSPIRRSGSGSYCDSYDSNSNQTISSDDYESCNGGTASDD